jgi:hypothetical protein
MAFVYDEAGLPSAYRGALARALSREGNVIYLAPDIEIFAPLDDVVAALPESDIVLVARSAAPPPPSEWTEGPFDAGYLGVPGGGRSGSPLDALHAWAADPDPWYLSLGDALWAAQVPILCSRPRVLRPPRHGLGPGNAAAFGVRLDAGGRLVTDAGPVTSCRTLGAGVGTSPIDRVAGARRQRLARVARPPLADSPYSFGRYRDGAPIPPGHRRAFLRLAAANRREIDNPFGERPTIELTFHRSPEQIERRVLDRYTFVRSRTFAIPGRAFQMASSVVRAISPSAHARAYGAVDRAKNGYRKLSRLLIKE